LIVQMIVQVQGWCRAGGGAEAVQSRSEVQRRCRDVDIIHHVEGQRRCRGGAEVQVWRCCRGAGRCSRVAEVYFQY